MKVESALSMVVLPAPVPPEIKEADPRLPPPRQKFDHVGGNGVVLDQVVDVERLDAETANRQRGAVDRSGGTMASRASTSATAASHHGTGFRSMAAGERARRMR